MRTDEKSWCCFTVSFHQCAARSFIIYEKCGKLDGVTDLFATFAVTSLALFSYKSIIVCFLRFSEKTDIMDGKQ